MMADKTLYDFDDATVELTRVFTNERPLKELLLEWLSSGSVAGKSESGGERE